MIKKALRLLAVAAMMMAAQGKAWAYDGSVVAPSGQTLYFEYADSTGGVTIVRPAGYWMGYAAPTGALVIPDSVLHSGTMRPVTAIAGWAFAACDGLTAVTLPQGLIAIGSRAFYVCDSLYNLVIPDGVTEIGNNAFNGIRHIEYHGNATYGTDTYWGAYSMNGVTVGDFVFADPTMTTLTAYIGTAVNVTIPATVDSIGKKAFYRFTWLSTVAFPEGLSFIGESAFNKCEALVGLTLPDSLKTVGAKAFYGCLNLSDVRIPDSVETIGRNAFYLFRHIEYHGGATYEEDNPYWGAYSLNGLRDGHFVYADSTCTTLTAYLGNGPHVTIPATVDSIEQGAFATCEGLTSVTLPEGLRYIGASAFSYCVGLTGIDIPDSVSTICGEAFSNCWALTSIHLGSGITQIMSKTFETCLVLTSVEIPEGVTSIGNYAFIMCRSLNTVTLPASVTAIGNYSFAECDSLADIYALGDMAPQLGNSVFSYSNEAMLVHIPCGSLDSYTAAWGGQAAHFSEELMHTLEVLSADEAMGSVEVLTEPDCGQQAVVQATAASGYRFEGWSITPGYQNLVTDNPLTITVTEDMTLVAHFIADGTEGIEDGIQTPSPTVRVADGRIIVEGAEGETVQVFDMTGRQLPTLNSQPSTGIYLVKVGSRPAQKIVVKK